MVGTRAIIPLISKYEEQLEIDASDILQKSLQLYELCLCLMESKNTSLVMQSLETLQQLLKTPSNIFKQMITSPQGKQVSLFFFLRYQMVTFRKKGSNLRKKSDVIYGRSYSGHNLKSQL